MSDGGWSSAQTRVSKGTDLLRHGIDWGGLRHLFGSPCLELVFGVVFENGLKVVIWGLERGDEQNPGSDVFAVRDLGFWVCVFCCFSTSSSVGMPKNK